MIFGDLPVETQTHGWLRREPQNLQHAEAEADAEALRVHVTEGEALLGGLPASPLRDTWHRKLAAEIHASCRRVRAAFMRAHADWLYLRLTAGRMLHLRLDELAARGREAVPGLLPTPDQLLQEQQCRSQRDKQGREVDQGIFFSQILHSSASGLHLIDAMLRPTRRAECLLDRFIGTGQVELGTVRIERRGAAAHLTLNNKECLNAEDNALVDDLETAVDLALLDDQVKVCVLRGGMMTHPRYAGKRVFCAGVNLKHLEQGKISYLGFMLKRELGLIHKIFRGLSSDVCGLGVNRLGCGKPWVAAVDSFAIGGGAQLLFAFDKVIAASDSYIALPAAQEGIIPGLANLRLARSVGARLAYQMILSGRRIYMEEPEARLLVDEVVAPEELDAAVDKAVDCFESPAVRTNRQMIRFAEEPIDVFRTYVAHFALEQAQRLYDEDIVNKSFKPSPRRETL